MPYRETYRQQVALLIRTLPLVAQENAFALKGGTAINLFVRNMPRLSVDIDLTYVPVQPRPESLAAIDAAIKRIAERVKRAIANVQITEAKIQPEGIITKLFVRAGGVQIKIEVTPVLRGCVSDPELRRVGQSVEDAFGFAEVPVVSFADLYAGKIVAALDRQHPRDFFDVRDLMANEGIDTALRRAFIVYLISHDRPMWEVLNCEPKDFREEFVRGFEGMTEQPVPIEELHAAREQLKKEVIEGMPDEHRRFLVSFERGQPDWPLLGVPGAPDLPAVRWRQQNLDTLTAEKRKGLVDRLKQVLRVVD